MATYEIAREEEGDKIIKKSGFSFEFSANSVTENLMRMDKLKKELTARRGLNSAEAENISRNHPFVKELTKDQHKIIYLYVQAMAKVEVCDEKLAQLEQAVNEEMAAIAEIKEQTGFEIPAFKVVITADQLGVKTGEPEPQVEAEQPKTEPETK